MSVFVFCTDTVHYGTEHVEMTMQWIVHTVRTPLVDPFPIEEDSSLKIQIEDHFLFSKKRVLLEKNSIRRPPKKSCKNIVARCAYGRLKVNC